MRRSHRILVALAAVLVLVWLLVRQRVNPHVDAQPTTASAVTRSEPVDVHTPEAPDVAPSEQARAAVKATAIKSTSTAPAEGPGIAPRAAARGRLFVVEQDGRESLVRNGVLFLGIRDSSNLSREEQVEVHAGAWRIEIGEASASGATKLHFTTAHVEERRMRVEAPTALVAFDDARELDVRVRRPARSLLRVIDAGANVDVQNVTLVRPAKRAYVQHPGLDLEPRIIVRERASPIELESLPQVELAQSTLIFVGAPGRAWQLFDHDFWQGGERVVALAPGADLSLAVRGVDPASESMLRIRRPDTRELIFECALTRDATLDLRGLPASALAIRAEVGSGALIEPQKLAELDLELAPATTTRAELVLSAAPEYSTAPVRGTLYAPVEWALGTPLLTLRSFTGAHVDRELGGVSAHCSRSGSDRVGFDAFSFSVDAAPVGHCEWLLWGQPNFSGLIDLPAAGVEGLELVLPAPAELEFELLDAETGERVADALLGWHGPRPAGVNDRGFLGAIPDADGVHRIRAPAGEFGLKTFTDGYEPYVETLHVSPGDARRIVRLKRPCRIEVSVSTNGAALPHARSWSATPSAVDGAGKVLSKRVRGSGLTYTVSSPGTYEVSPDPLPGYRTPAPQRVEVQRGAPVSIEFVFEAERR